MSSHQRIWTHWTSLLRTAYSDPDIEVVAINDGFEARRSRVPVAI